jgi:hypothetical protein
LEETSVSRSSVPFSGRIWPARISDWGEPVDEDDPGLDGGKGSREILGALRSGRLPAAEIGFEKRLDLGERLVGHDEDLGIVGPQPCVLEGDEVGARHLLDHFRIAGAGEGHAVRVRLAIEQRRQRAEGDRVGLGHLVGDARELLAAQPLDLGGIEGWVADDVGEQLQRGREIGG